MSHKRPQEPVLEFFVVKAADGRYFKSRGCSVDKDWVSNIRDAQVYLSAGPAKSQVTWLLHNCPEMGVPEVMILEAHLAGSIKTKVSARLSETYDRLSSRLKSYDADIQELELEISDSDSEVARKLLGNQIAGLQAKRRKIDRDATTIRNRLSRVRTSLRETAADATCNIERDSG